MAGDWPRRPLKCVARINARTLSEDTDPSWEFSYVDIGSVRAGGQIEEPAKVDFGSAPTRARRLVRQGDTIVSTVRTYLRAIAQVPQGAENWVCSTGFATLSPTQVMNPRFLSWWCQSEQFVQEVMAQSAGVSYPAISPSDLGSIDTPVPPLAKQRAIADFLDRETARIDEVVERKRALMAVLDERRRAAICLGVCGLLEDAPTHDVGIPWAPRVRAPWPGVKIKHVAQLGTGHTPSRSRPELWEDCTIPWITTGEIQQVRDDRREVITETREKVSEAGLTNSSAVLRSKGTVVLCRTASAGFSAIMGTDMATSQDFVTWTCTDRVLPRYLLMCLRGMRGHLLGRLAYGSTHKTIYMPDIEALVIPLPSVDEQHEALHGIDRRVKPIDALVERIDLQIERLAEHRRALVTAAVTGQVDASPPIAPLDGQ